MKSLKSFENKKFFQIEILKSSAFRKWQKSLTKSKAFFLKKAKKAWQNRKLFKKKALKKLATFNRRHFQMISLKWKSLQQTTTKSIKSFFRLFFFQVWIALNGAFVHYSFIHQINWNEKEFQEENRFFFFLLFFMQTFLDQNFFFNFFFIAIFFYRLIRGNETCFSSEKEHKSFKKESRLKEKKKKNRWKC